MTLAADTAHISRSWPGGGTPMEDACPCPQEPCGYVAMNRVDPACEQHSIAGGKTIRGSHQPENCPGAWFDRSEIRHFECESCGWETTTKRPLNCPKCGERLTAIDAAGRRHPW